MTDVKTEEDPRRLYYQVAVWYSNASMVILQVTKEGHTQLTTAEEAEKLAKGTLADKDLPSDVTHVVVYECQRLVSFAVGSEERSVPSANRLAKGLAKMCAPCTRKMAKAVTKAMRKVKVNPCLHGGSCLHRECPACAILRGETKKG